MTQQRTAASNELEQAARTLIKRRWSGKVKGSDPRLGEGVTTLHRHASTAREAGEFLLARPPIPAKQTKKAAQVRHFVAEADNHRRLSVVEELETIVVAVLNSDRGWQAIRLRLGLDGEPAKTLQGVGSRLGITRERVRQIEKRLSDQLNQQQVWSPAFCKTIRTLRDAIPLTEEEAQELLHREQLLARSESLPFKALFKLGMLLHKDLPFEVAEGWLFPTGSGEAVSALGSHARRLITHWGTTTVDELRTTLVEAGIGKVDDQTARTILESIDGFNWLDREVGWFWIKGTARNRLLNQIEKIMSVAGSIEIGELRDGVGRHHRMKGFRPPREVLARLCEDSALYERHVDTIIGRDLPDWRKTLGKNEATIVSVLFEHGPVLRRDELERYAVEEHGLNRSSFYIYLTYSPVLQRYAPGVFGLRGAKISAAEVKAMIPSRARRQVLQDHGWTQDGKVWIAYKISPSGASSGVLGVPSVLDELLHGSFVLSSEDGRPVGTLVVDDNMWGLSPFYRRWGVEAGDHVVVTVDLNHGTATIAAGAEDLLLRYQQGE